ncbi:MAG: IS110 family transposase [Bryobacteraceae bacterium]
MSSSSFSMIHPHAAGIDIGSREHWVAVPEDRDERSVRRFGCFTADLYALADWLKRCGVETVAMESTGVYWIPLYQILEERGFEVKLVNAHHVKNVPGRKSDVQDCRWLQRLHSYGLLSGSFRPEAQVCVLRSYLRQRDNLIRYASAHIQHMQKALTEMNLHLHKVLSDITGVTGMRMVRAILEGQRNPVALAAMRDGRVKSSAAEIAKALEGDYRPEHLFVLRQAVELYDIYHEKIASCDREIEAVLSAFEARSPGSPCPPAKPRKRRKNEPYFDLRSHLFRVTGVDFTQIKGLDTSTVQTILSEVGLDPSRFPSEKHFCSWMGLCPDNRITGGKIKKRSTRKVTNRAADAFRLAAQSVANSLSALGGYYRRMKARLGSPKAITATAHKLARLFYRLWKTGDAYQDPGLDYYEKRYQERLLSNMKRKAKEIGFMIDFQPLAESVS